MEYYEPTTDRTFYVGQGISPAPDSPWFTLYTKNKKYSSHRLKAPKALPGRATKDDAQADLDVYANQKGWQTLKEMMVPVFKSVADAPQVQDTAQDESGWPVEETPCPRCLYGPVRCTHPSAGDEEFVKKIKETAWACCFMPSKETHESQLAKGAVQAQESVDAARDEIKNFFDCDNCGNFKLGGIDGLARFCRHPHVNDPDFFKKVYTTGGARASCFIDSKAPETTDKTQTRKRIMPEDCPGCQYGPIFPCWHPNSREKDGLDFELNGREHRGCFTPKKEEHVQESKVQESSNGNLKYFDPEKNRTYFVSQEPYGNDPDAWWMLAYRKGDGPVKAWKKIAMPTKEEAEAMLKTYAEFSWQEVHEEDRLPAQETADTPRASIVEVANINQMEAYENAQTQPSPESAGYGYEMAALGLIDPNPKNPRKHFDEAALNELADSIRQLGLLQPIVVVRNGLRFRIVYGERRYRASQIAGLQQVQVIIKDFTVKQELEAMLAENIQRKDLDAIEEANAFSVALANGYTQTELAEKLGISQPLIANRLRLLKLPKNIQEIISREILSAGHGLGMVKIASFPELVTEVSKYVQDNNVPVAGTEDKVDRFIRDKGYPLFKDSYYGRHEKLAFDPDRICENNCRNRLLVKPEYSMDGNKKHPYCLDGKCWQMKQHDAQEMVAMELIAKASPKGDSADKKPVDIKDLRYNQYKTFRHTKVNSDGCIAAQCDFLKVSKGEGYVCMKPSCFQEKEKKIERSLSKEANKEKRSFEQVKEDIIMRGLFDESGQVRKDVMVYMVAAAVEDGPSSSQWSHSKIETSLCEQMHWTLDENTKENDWNGRHESLIRHINTLSVDDLWKVLLFCMLKPADHTRTVYKLTLGAAAGGTE